MERAGNQEPSPNDTIGTVGRFELLEAVGSGGFGDVYRAHDTLLDREVALKLPRFSQGDTTRIRRFFIEATSAARLRHPNIVAVFDAGQSDEGQYYIASEFIRGKPLTSFVHDESVTLAERVNWVRDLALALHYAHQIGIVHRDIKPDNILIDETQKPQITDFGLAKQLDERSSLQTQDGSLLGTPAYMSPEQARGEITELGPGSDQYSLGVVLYELLCGERPFEGKTHQIIAAVAGSSEAKGIRQVNSSVSPDLGAICMKAIEKKIPRRYTDCLEFAEDLSRYLAGRATRARPLSWTAQSRRWMARNPLVTSLIGAVVLSITVGFALVSFALWDANRERTAKQVALDGETNARVELQRKNEQLNAAMEAEKSITNSLRASERELKLSQSSLRQQLARSILEDARAAGPVTRMIRYGEALGFAEGKLLERLRVVATAAIESAPRVLRLDGKPWAAAINEEHDQLSVLTLEGGVTRFRCCDGAMTGALQLDTGEKAMWRGAITHDAGVGFFPTSGSNAVLIDFNRLRRAEIRLSADEVDGRDGPSYAFSADGKMLATCLGDELRVWRTSNGRLVWRSDAPVPRLTSIAMSDDGKSVCGCDGRRVFAWTVGQEGHESIRFRGLASEISEIALSPDGTEVAILHQTGIMSKRTNGSSKQSERAIGVGGVMSADSLIMYQKPIQFTPDGSRLIVYNQRDSIEILHARSLARWREPLRVRPSHFLRRGIAISPDGALVAHYQENGIEVFDSWSGVKVCSLNVPFPSGIQFSTGGAHLLIARGDEVVIWELRQAMNSPTSLESKVWGTDQASQGDTLAIREVLGDPVAVEVKAWAEISEQGVLTLRDVDSGVVRRSVRCPPGLRGGVSISSDARHVAHVADEQYEVHVYDISAQVAKLVARLPLTEDHFQSTFQGVLFRPKSAAVLLSGMNVAKLWDFSNTTALHRYSVVNGGLNRERARFSRDGRLLAVPDAEGNVPILDVDTGQPVTYLRTDGTSRFAALDPSSTRALVCSYQRGRYVLEVWDITTGHLLAPAVSLSYISNAMFVEGGIVANGIDGYQSSVQKVYQWAFEETKPSSIETLQDRIQTKLGWSFEKSQWMSQREQQAAIAASPIAIAEDANTSWHRYRAAVAAKNGDLFANRFHVERLGAGESAFQLNELGDFGIAIDPDKDCNIQVSDQGLEISCPGTPHDMTNRRANAPRVLRHVVGDFEYEVTVHREFAPGKPTVLQNLSFQSAGIIVWSGSRHGLIRLEAAVRRDMQPAGQPPAKQVDYLHFESRGAGLTEGRQGVIRDGLLENTEPVRLRLRRVGDKFWATFRQPGSDWRTLSLKMDLPAGVWIGPCVINAADNEANVRFSNVVLR